MLFTHACSCRRLLTVHIYRVKTTLSYSVDFHLLMTILSTEVIVGSNLLSSGVGISCFGNESNVLECRIRFNTTLAQKLSCSGGATTISCLASGTVKTVVGML